MWVFSWYSGFSVQKHALRPICDSKYPQIVNKTVNGVCVYHNGLVMVMFPDFALCELEIGYGRLHTTIEYIAGKIMDGWKQHSGALGRVCIAPNEADTTKWNSLTDVLVNVGVRSVPIKAK